MASRIKVDEVTNLAQSGAVSFPTGGATFSGNVNVTGNIDFTGDLLQNGQPFVTLPEQNVNNIGYTLRSGGSTGVAYWDSSGEGDSGGGSQAMYKAGFDITRGFACAGYRGGNSWKNVNRLVMSTYTNSNLGDLLTYSGAYLDCAQNTSFKNYVFATCDSWNGTCNYVSSISMVTETNTGLATAMSSNRNRCTCLKKDFT